MKKLLFTVLLLVFTLTEATLTAQEQTQTQEQAEAQAQDRPQERPTGPHFAFENTEYDFGDINHDLPKVECRFSFTNDGIAPLVITRILTSCSCVKTEYSKRPIPPGGEGEIVITYEVNKKESGVFYKVIEVYSNSTDKRNNLIVKGNAVEL